MKSGRVSRSSKAAGEGGAFASPYWARWRLKQRDNRHLPVRRARTIEIRAHHLWFGGPSTEKYVCIPYALLPPTMMATLMSYCQLTLLSHRQATLLLRRRTTLLPRLRPTLTMSRRLHPPYVLNNSLLHIFQDANTVVGLVGLASEELERASFVGRGGGVVGWEGVSL